jgi:gag-polypeptide of LTR copia-type
MQNMQLAPGDTVGDYLNTITTYVNQLRSMGITVSDQDITNILLANLPSSYDSIATALIIHHGQPTISEVSAALLEYEMWLKEGELNYRITTNVAKSGCGKPSGAKTLANSKPADDTKKGNHCYCCQQPGHFVHDCMAPAPVHAETATIAVADSKPIVLF